MLEQRSSAPVLGLSSSLMALVSVQRGPGGHSAAGRKRAWLTGAARMGRAGFARRGAVFIDWGSPGSVGILGIRMDTLSMFQKRSSVTLA